MGYSRYIGRVGALAVMLGVGTAVAVPGVAWAEETDGASPSAGGGADTSQESTSTDSDPDPSADAEEPSAGVSSGPSETSSSEGQQSSSEPDEDGGSSGSAVTVDLGGGVVVSSSGGSLPDEHDEDDEEEEDDEVVEPPADNGVSGAQPAALQQESRQSDDSDRAAAQSVVTVPDIQTVAAATVESPAVVASSVDTAPPPAEESVVLVSADETVVESISAPAEEQSESAPEETTVLTTLFSPSATGEPEAPAENPLVWALAAAARREVGVEEPPVTAVESGTTGDVDTGEFMTMMAAVAASDPALGEIIIDPLTGVVTGTFVPPGDPAPPASGIPRKPTYTVTVPPGAGQGTFTINKTTGQFTYTPTALQRVLAGFSANPEDTVAVTVTVTYGTTKVTVPVSVSVDPVSIADIGEVSTGEGALGLAVTNDRAYVTNFDAGTVTVIDTIHGTVIDNIVVDPSPIGVVVTPDGKKIYVSSQETDSISVIDTTTRNVIATISLGAKTPELMAISPDGKTIYVTTTVYDPNRPGEFIALSGDITKISTTTNKVFGAVKNVGLVPYNITVSPDGKKVYVQSVISGPDAEEYRTGVFVFSSTSTTAKQILNVGDEPEALAVSRDNKFLYVGDYPSGTISVVNTTTNLVVATIQAGEFSVDEIVVHPSNTMLMVLNYETQALDLYDITNNYAYMGSAQTNATTDLNFPEARISPDGQQLYYTSDGHLQIISLVPVNQFPDVGTPTPGAPVLATGAVTGGYGVSDPDDDKLSYVLKTGPTKGKVVLNTNGTWTYTPTAAARHAASKVGAGPELTQDSFVVTVSDGRRGTVEQTVFVDISPTNKSVVVKQSVGSPNTTTGVVAVTVSASDGDGDVPTFSTPAGAQYGSVTGVKGKYVYTPTAEARHAAATLNGPKTDSFTVTVDDGHGSIQTVTVTVKIAPKNSAPVSTVSLGAPSESDGAIIGTVRTTDADPGDAAGVVLSTGTTTPKKGSVTYDNNAKTFSYTPTEAARLAAAATNAPSTAKTDKFTVIVDDGHGGKATLTVTVNIMATGNENPVNGNFTVDPPAAATGAIKGTVTAEDENPRIYTGSQTTSKGKVVVSANGTFTYTPTAAARHAASANGAGIDDTTDKFNVTVTDGKGGLLSVEVTVAISPKNTAPVGKYTANKPIATTGVVTGKVTATDADKDTVSISGPATGLSTKGGAVAVNADGTFSYTPTEAARFAAAQNGAPGSAKTDTFTVTLNDAHQPSGTTNVTVTVSIAPGTATSTPGMPLANVIVGKNGTLYQMTTTSFEDPANPILRVSVLDSTGRVVATTSAIPGAGVQLPVARPDGSLLVVSQGTSSVHVSVVNSSGVVTPVGGPIAGVAAGAIQVSSTNGAAYFTVTNPAGGFKVVRISSTNALKTYDVAAFDSGGTPVVLPDGRAYAIDHDFATSTSRVLVINGAGTASYKSMSGISGGPLTVATDGTVYATSGSTLYTFKSSGTPTERQLGGIAIGSMVVGKAGAVYQVTQGATPGTSAIAKFTSAGAVTKASIAGAPAPAMFGQSSGGMKVASDGTVYVAVVDQLGNYGVATWRPSSTTTDIRQVDGHIVNLAYAYPYSEGEPNISVSPDNKAYVAVVDDLGAYSVYAFGSTGGPTITEMPNGSAIGTRVVFDKNNRAYQVVNRVTASGVESAVVVLATGATSEWVIGTPPALTDPVVFGPDGRGYLVTLDADFVSGAVTAGRVLVFNSNGTTRALLTGPDGILPRLEPVNGAAFPQMKWLAFANDGTAYVTFAGLTQNPDLDTHVWKIPPTGAPIEVLDTDNAIASAVTVANGKAYVTVGKVINGAWVTMVQELNAPSVL